MSDTKLKPCPFCGSEDIKDLGMIKGCGVSCINEDCAAYMANVPIQKWNTRHGERENNQLRADLKQCAEALTDIGYNYNAIYAQKLARKALSIPSVQSALKDQTK